MERCRFEDTDCWKELSILTYDSGISSIQINEVDGPVLELMILSERELATLRYMLAGGISVQDH